MYKKRLEANITKIYISSFLGAAFFFTPILVLFWLENGLSLTQIMVIQSLFAIMTVALEIPSGYFADVYGRKLALIISAIGFTLCIIISAFSHNFWQFLLAEVFAAIGMAMSSGAFEAFLFDTLKELKREKEYKKIMGTSGFLRMVFLGLGSILGGIIAKTNYRLTFYLSIPFWVIFVILFFTLQEPKRHQKVIKSHFKNIKSIFKSTFKNKKLSWLITSFGVLFALVVAVQDFVQPYMKLLHIDVVYFGILYASFMIVGALSSLFSHKLEKKIGPKKAIIIPFLLVIIGYFLLGKIIFAFGFVFLYSFYIVEQFIMIVFTDYVNKLVDSSKRATVISIQNMSGRLVYALILPLAGWIADLYNVFSTFIVLGFVALVVGIVILPILKKVELI